MWTPSGVHQGVYQDFVKDYFLQGCKAVSSLQYSQHTIGLKQKINKFIPFKLKMPKFNFNYCKSIFKFLILCLWIKKLLFNYNIQNNLTIIIYRKMQWRWKG